MSHPSMHKHAVPCDCGCGVVLITTFEPWGTEPDEVYVEFFESFQGGNLRMRLRAAWRVVRGKDPWLHAAVFQDEGLRAMRAAFGAASLDREHRP